MPFRTAEVDLVCRLRPGPTRIVAVGRAVCAEKTDDMQFLRIYALIANQTAGFRDPLGNVITLIIYERQRQQRGLFSIAVTKVFKRHHGVLWD